jgi:hypothetical protein
MKLQDVSVAMRAAGDLAHVGERLFDSLAASRRHASWPLMIGIGLGVGIGALLFSETARNRVRGWARAVHTMDAAVADAVEPTMHAPPPPAVHRRPEARPS